MSLIELIIVLAVIGVVLWAINNYIPMQTNIKKILNVVVVVATLLFVLNAFGVIGSAPRFRIGRW
ncbi:MAG: Thivi_2564 family membrane protein [Alkalispirochaeta sp.]